jgi:hypothetical protein
MLAVISGALTPGLPEPWGFAALGPDHGQPAEILLWFNGKDPATPRHLEHWAARHHATVTAAEVPGMPGHVLASATFTRAGAAFTIAAQLPATTAPEGTAA